MMAHWARGTCGMMGRTPDFMNGVVMSMAASSHSDVSRGMGFLLDRHRINVAVSRGQHAAFLVRSEVLTDFAPRTPDELIALGAFLGLCTSAVTTETITADLVPA